MIVCLFQGSGPRIIGRGRGRQPWAAVLVPHLGRKGGLARVLEVQRDRRCVTPEPRCTNEQ